MNRTRPARIAIFCVVFVVTAMGVMWPHRSKRNNHADFVGADGLIAAGAELEFASLDVDAPKLTNIEQPPDKPSEFYLPENALRMPSVPLYQKIPIYDYDPFGRKGSIIMCYWLGQPPQDLTKVGDANALPQRDNGN